MLAPALPASGADADVTPAGALPAIDALPAGSAANSDAVSRETAASGTLPSPAILAPISVTATRSTPALADPSASVSEVTREEIDSSAATTLDDVLRRVPGFSLFRRLGSGAAHPTTQGVSLRGIGPSGTSRALVLVDGVPQNDAFGGWVYWSRIPSESIERVEVLRGSGSSLWGNYAMGGVIGVVTRPTRANAGRFVAEGGEDGNARTEGWISRRFGDTSALVDGRWQDSGQYFLVSDASRGPIDVRGGSENGMGGIRIDHQLTPSVSVHAAARGFHEYRDNGTPYQHNATSSGFFRTGLDVKTASAGTVTADVFGNVQKFWSTFSAVPPDRASETPAADQFNVPSTSAGGSVVWSQQWNERHHLAAGIDTMWVEGKTKEFARFIDGMFTRRRAGGASQVMEGIFAEDIVHVTRRLDATAALRVDHWQSYDGFRNEDSLDTGMALDRDLADHEDTLVSPRVGLALDATDSLVLRTAAYRGFREPTINEQVRPFRVRNDITEANDALDAEKLFGVEAGFDHVWGPLRSSATLFWNEVDDPVFNVTVGAGPGPVDPCGFVPAGGVCRQRRNLGSTRIVGVETDTAIDLGHGLAAWLAYLWSDGEIHSAETAPALVGNRIPQVPRHQGTIALDYDDGGAWRASLQVRIVGEQFEDDANTLELDRFAALDAFVARKIGWGFEVFAAAENLFDETIQTGRSADDVVSVGAPRIVRAGVRYGFDETADNSAGSVK